MEIIAILTMAKEAGFEVGTMITLAAIFWRIDSRQNKRHETMRKENSEFWKKLIDALSGHREETEKRFEPLETDIKDIKKKLQTRPEDAA